MKTTEEIKAILDDPQLEKDYWQLIKDEVEQVEQDERFTRAAIAGGHPANFLFNRVYPDKPLVLNDIDMYHHSRAYVEYNDIWNHGVEEIRGKQGEYPVVFVANRWRVAIKQRETIGNVDFIGVDLRGGVTVSTLYKMFDLNCVQATYDILTQSFDYTDDFLEFLRTLQIRIVNVHHVKTLCRGQRKAKQLDVYFDYDDGLRFISNVARGYRIRTDFNEIEIDHYGDVNIELLAPDPVLVNVSPTITREQYITLHALLYYSKRHLRDNVLKCLQYPRLSRFLIIHGADYLDHNPLWSQANTLEKVFSDHGGVMAIVNSLTLNEQIEAIKGMRGIVEKYGPMAWGFIENSKRFVSKDIPLMLRSIELAIVEERKQMRKPLIEPLIAIPINYRHVTVTELTTPLALADEGSSMRHCVGGYSHAIRSGRSRLFSLVSKEGRTTLELNVNYDSSYVQSGEYQSIGGFTVRQHRSKCNGRPLDLHKRTAQVLVKELTEEYKGYKIPQRTAYSLQVGEIIF